MKIKVLKKFKDIHTKEIYSPGDVFEADEKRLTEINEVDKTLVEVIEEKEKAAANKKSATGATKSRTKSTT